MRGNTLRVCLAAFCVMAILMVVPLVASAQTTGSDLAVKFRTAQELYDRGDYAGSRTLLLEVKESISVAGTRVSPETIRSID